MTAPHTIDSANAPPVSGGAADAVRKISAAQRLGGGRGDPARLLVVLAQEPEPVVEADLVALTRLSAFDIKHFEHGLVRGKPAWVTRWAAAGAVIALAKARPLAVILLRLAAAQQASGSDFVRALAMGLAAIPSGERPARLKALTRALEGERAQPAAAADSAAALSALATLRLAIGPASTPFRFAETVLALLPVWRALDPHMVASIPLGTAQRPVDRIAPAIDPPFDGLLRRKSWGSLAGDCDLILWERLCRHAKSKGQPDSGTETEPRAAADDGAFALDRTAAKILQAELRARNYFLATPAPHAEIQTALDKADGAVAKRYKQAAARQRAVLQAVRNLAAQRGYAALGAEGDVVAFDPVRHVLEEEAAVRPSQVRLLDPPIIRRLPNGSEELLASGIVEPADDA